MTSRLAWIWGQLTGRLWLRAGLFGLGAVAAATGCVLAGVLMPDWLVSRVDADAVGDLLHIMASSMLVVATFSLGSLVTALTVAAGNATPRAARILIADPYAQNALAIFIAAFVFSIVGLIGMKLGYYSAQELAALMVATIAMIAAVILTLFAWIDYLANLMRVDEMMNKLELRAGETITARARNPHLGGRPPDATGGGVPVRTVETGYVRHLDVGRLQKIAAACQGTIRVLHLPGALVNPVEPLAEATWEADAATRADIVAAFNIGPERSFDQDPRFCLEVVTEIASRALSPGMNDPGTAISAIGRLQRLLSVWAKEARGEVAPECPDVTVPELTGEALMEDAFGPLTRDAAGMVEVGLRLQKALKILSRFAPELYGEAARDLAARALEQAEAELTLASDRDRLARVAPDNSP